MRFPYLEKAFTSAPFLSSFAIFFSSCFFTARIRGVFSFHSLKAELENESPALSIPFSMGAPKIPMASGEKKTAAAIPATLRASALFAAAATMSETIAVPPAIIISGHATAQTPKVIISHKGISKSIKTSKSNRGNNHGKSNRFTFCTNPSTSKTKTSPGRKKRSNTQKAEPHVFIFLFSPYSAYIGSSAMNQLPPPSCIIATSAIFTSASPLCVYAMLTVWNALPLPLSLNFAGLIMMRILSTFP